MNSLYLCLIAAVSARPFLVNEAVERGAAMLADYHASGIDSSSASALASQIIGSYVDAPPISSFVQDMIHQVEREVMGAGGISNIKVTPAQILDVMTSYKGAYDAFHATADFEAFRKAVAAAVPKFDSKKMIAEAESLAKQANASGDAKKMYASFTNQPSGKLAVSGAQDLYNLHNQVFGLHLPAFSHWLNLI